MTLDISLEMGIDKLLVNTKRDFKYYLLWTYYSFRKQKIRKKKSKTFTQKQEDLKLFKTRIHLSLPLDLKNDIVQL
jgi:hypothetical protein